MFFFERQCETVDDGAENFQQLRDTVVSLGLVHELEEDVVDGSPDECTQVEKFPVDSVQGSFQKVAFPRIFAVEQFQQLEKINCCSARVHDEKVFALTCNTNV